MPSQGPPVARTWRGVRSEATPKQGVRGSWAARSPWCHAIQLAQEVPQKVIKDQIYIGESFWSLPTRQDFHLTDFGAVLKEEEEEEGGGDRDEEKGK